MRKNNKPLGSNVIALVGQEEKIKMKHKALVITVNFATDYLYLYVSYHLTT